MDGVVQVEEAASSMSSRLSILFPRAAVSLWRARCRYRRGQSGGGCTGWEESSSLWRMFTPCARFQSRHLSFSELAVLCGVSPLAMPSGALVVIGLELEKSG